MQSKFCDAPKALQGAGTPKRKLCRCESNFGEGTFGYLSQILAAAVTLKAVIALQKKSKAGRFLVNPEELVHLR